MASKDRWEKLRKVVAAIRKYNPAGDDAPIVVKAGQLHALLTEQGELTANLGNVLDPKPRCDECDRHNNSACAHCECDQRNEARAALAAAGAAP